jgi:hypothetical protein
MPNNVPVYPSAPTPRLALSHSAPTSETFDQVIGSHNRFLIPASDIHRFDLRARRNKKGLFQAAGLTSDLLDQLIRPADLLIRY